jgi:hypothetical protein
MQRHRYIYIYIYIISVHLYTCPYIYIYIHAHTRKLVSGTHLLVGFRRPPVSSSWPPSPTLAERLAVVVHDSCRIWEFAVRAQRCAMLSAFPGHPYSQRFYCILHVLKRLRAATTIPWECPHPTLLICFTRCEKILGDNLDSLGVTAATFLYCLARLECVPWTKIASMGVLKFNLSISFLRTWRQLAITT